MTTHNHPKPNPEAVGSTLAKLGSDFPAVGILVAAGWAWSA